jgi:SAM-dependent methyltransferase
VNYGETYGDPGHPVILFVEDDPSPAMCERLAAGARCVVRHSGGDPVAVLDDLALDRVHLVARDTEAARRVVLARPDRVASLILLSNAPPPDTTVPTLVIEDEDVVPAILRHTAGGWQRQASRLATHAVAAGTPSAWFEQLYSSARRGEVDMPWDWSYPNALLEQWSAGRSGNGRRALVVGCGLGRDAEHLAALGFDTDAFDVSESAIATARARRPDSPVRYRTADLFDLPADWRGAFDLVVESYTVQALPRDVRARAIAAVAALVGPGGTLLAIAVIADKKDDIYSGPPWPLNRAEVESFATHELTQVRIDAIPDPTDPDIHRWLAEFCHVDGPQVGAAE